MFKQRKDAIYTSEINWCDIRVGVEITGYSIMLQLGPLKLLRINPVALDKAMVAHLVEMKREAMQKLTEEDETLH